MTYTKYVSCLAALLMLLVSLADHNPAEFMPCHIFVKTEDNAELMSSGGAFSEL